MTYLLQSPLRHPLNYLIRIAMIGISIATITPVARETPLDSPHAALHQTFNAGPALPALASAR